MSAPERVARAKIFLHGRLRERFGALFELGVTTPAGAVQALCTLVPGFREELAQGAYRVRRGTRRRGTDLSAAGLRLQLGPEGHLHIIPVAAGAKGGSGIGKIIVGVVLIVASVLLMQPEIGGALGRFASSFGCGDSRVPIPVRISATPASIISPIVTPPTTEVPRPTEVPA